MAEFQQIRNTRIVAVVTSTILSESLIKECRIYNIQINEDIKDVRVPSPSLFVLGSTRIHDVFKLVDIHKPAAIFLDMPQIIPSKSLQAVATCAAEKSVPIFIYKVSNP